MNNNEKHAFVNLMTKIGELYDKKMNPERIALYWNALEHRDIVDIKAALNRHIQDPERGRFFPLPADISAQLPSESNAWLNANEAWAACPKDEITSAAMCEEMSKALYIAKDLINEGDSIAARMAFIEHYNRLLDEAKRDNRKPKWFPSYGMDKESRQIADREVIERKNLALPSDEKLSLPEPEEVKAIEYKNTKKSSIKNDPVKISEYVAGLNNILKR